MGNLVSSLCCRLCKCCHRNDGYQNLVSDAPDSGSIDMVVRNNRLYQTELIFSAEGNSRPIVQNEVPSRKESGTSSRDLVQNAQTPKEGDNEAAHFSAPLHLAASTNAPVPVPVPAPVTAAMPIPAISTASAKSGLFMRYDMKEVVGEGSTSKCHKVIRKSDGAVFACKTLDHRNIATKFSTALLDQLLMEVRVLKHLREHSEQHPNIVRFEEHYETNERTYLVMEMVSGGELFDYIAYRGTLTEAEAAGIMHKLVSVVHHLHSMNIIHRDLKPENLLLAYPLNATKASTRDVHGNICSVLPPTSGIVGDDSEHGPVLKVIDFGLAKSLSIEAPGTLARTYVGTKGYLAPELYQHVPYDGAVDMWALGVIAYVLLTGCMPFANDAEVSVQTSTPLSTSDLHEVFAWDLPMWASALSINAKDFLRKLLAIDPRNRMTAKQALAHPWIQPDGAPTDRYLQSPLLLAERLEQKMSEESVYRKPDVGARRETKAL